VLTKQANEKLDLSNLVNEETKPGLLSQIFLGPKYRRESGRVAGLAEAMGEDPSATIRYPVTSRAMNQIGGASLGSLIGAILSKGKAAGLGGSVGAIAGTAKDIKDNEKEKARIVDMFNQKNDSGNLTTKEIKPGSLLASLISGVHQDGRADASDFVSKKQVPEANDKLQAIAELLNFTGIGTGISGPVSLGNSFVDFKNSERRINSNKQK
jgi:hypothetical protein